MLAMTLNVVFSLFFSTLFTRLGWMPHGGLALANSLATALEMAGLYVIMRRRLNGLNGAVIWQAAWQATIATAVMGVALWLWLLLNQEQPAWLVVGSGLALGVVMFGLVALGLRVSEVSGLLAAAIRRFQRIVHRPAI